jgi:hypothetical protein
LQVNARLNADNNFTVLASLSKLSIILSLYGKRQILAVEIYEVCLNFYELSSKQQESFRRLCHNQFGCVSHTQSCVTTKRIYTQTVYFDSSVFFRLANVQQFETFNVLLGVCIYKEKYLMPHINKTTLSNRPVQLSTRSMLCRPRSPS